MDQNREIKEEPVWLGGASTSFPSADVKDELIEEQIVNQLVPCLKEENNEGNVDVRTRSPLRSTGGCSQEVTGKECLKRNLLTDTRSGCYCCNECEGSMFDSWPAGYGSFLWLKDCVVVLSKQSLQPNIYNSPAPQLQAVSFTRTLGVSTPG
ncbi:uncharacterized protein [Anabrus simplex]|uniref:uncharacterized protein n=1 Tax=Anabrus simplex TaxID=316456 RepID=UPI0035A2BDB4